MATSKPLTHADLVKRAISYLRNRESCVLFAPEPSVYREVPDAIGWTAHNECILIECKVSRADFRADAKKPHRHGSAGVGHRRYYMVPEGLIEPREVPKGWGLLVIKGRSTFCLLEAERRDTHDHATNAGLLLYLARRACNYDPAALVAQIEAERARNRQIMAGERERERQRKAAQAESMTRLAERAAVVRAFDLEDEGKQWVCECGATPDLSGAWRWTEDGYEHHHGYPIGHVLARKIESLAA